MMKPVMTTIWVGLALVLLVAAVGCQSTSISDPAPSVADTASSNPMPTAVDEEPRPTLAATGTAVAADQTESPNSLPSQTLSVETPPPSIDNGRTAYPAPPTSATNPDEDAPRLSVFQYRPCYGRGSFDRRNQNFVEWTPDGGSIVFAEGDHLRVVRDREGAEVRSIVDMNPLVDMTETGRFTGFEYGIHADLSPDGSRIVYSTCEHLHFGRRDYEIAVIGVDGSSPARLTVNEQQDNFPVWSPDGSRFAFHSNSVYGPGVIIMSADGSYISHVARWPFRLGAHFGYETTPPSWSPDGSRLAFGTIGSVFTVPVDGTGRIEIAGWPGRIEIASWPGLDDVVAGPVWSPDGDEIAFATGNYAGGKVAIYIVKSDGTGLREIWSVGDEYIFLIHHLSWSPDGSELLFGYGIRRLYAIRPDGSGLRQFHTAEWPALSLSYDSSPEYAAWSPDGSRIAVVYNWGHALFTMARDGSDIRYLLTKPERCSVDPDRGKRCRWVTPPPPPNIYDQDHYTDDP